MRNKRMREMLWLSTASGRRDAFYPFYVQKAKAEVMELMGLWDEATGIYRQMESVARQAGDRDCLAESCTKLGWLMHKKGDENAAMSLLKQAEEHYGWEKKYKELGAVTNKIGNLHSRRGEYDKAEEFLLASLKMAREMGDRSGMTVAMNNLGNNCGDRGDYVKALDYYQQSYDLDLADNDRLNAGIDMGNMGWVHLLMGDQNKAVDCWERQVESSNKLGDKHSLSIALGNLSAVHMMRGDYDRGLRGIAERLKIAGEMGDKKGLSISYSHLANVHAANREFGLAIEAFEKAIGLAREIGLKYYLTIFLQEAGEVNLEDGQIERAGELCRESLELASSINKKDTIFKCRLLMAKIAAGRDRAEGVRELKELWPEAGQPDQQASLHYELFKHTGEDGHREKALDIYAELNAKSPNVELRKRIEELKR